MSINGKYLLCIESWSRTTPNPNPSRKGTFVFEDLVKEFIQVDSAAEAWDIVAQRSNTLMALGWFGTFMLRDLPKGGPAPARYDNGQWYDCPALAITRSPIANVIDARSVVTNGRPTQWPSA